MQSMILHVDGWEQWKGVGFGFFSTFLLSLASVKTFSSVSLSKCKALEVLLLNICYLKKQNCATLYSRIGLKNQVFFFLVAGSHWFSYSLQCRGCQWIATCFPGGPCLLEKTSLRNTDYLQILKPLCSPYQRPYKKVWFCQFCPLWLIYLQTAKIEIFSSMQEGLQSLWKNNTL